MGRDGEQRKTRTIWFATHGCDCTPAARRSRLCKVVFCVVDFSKDEEIDDQVGKIVPVVFLTGLTALRLDLGCRAKREPLTETILAS